MYYAVIMGLYELLGKLVTGLVPKIWISNSPYYVSKIQEAQRSGEVGAYVKAELEFHKQLNIRMELSKQIIDAIKGEKARLEQLLEAAEGTNRELKERNVTLQEDFDLQSAAYNQLHQENLKQQDSLRELLPVARAETARTYQKLKLLCKQLPHIKDKSILFVGPNGLIEDFNDFARNKIRNYQSLLGADYEDFIKLNPVKSLRLVNKQGRWIEIGNVFYDPVAIEFQTDKSGVVILEKITSVHKYFIGRTRKFVKEMDDIIRMREAGGLGSESG